MFRSLGCPDSTVSSGRFIAKLNLKRISSHLPIRGSRNLGEWCLIQGLLGEGYQSGQMILEKAMR